MTQSTYETLPVRCPECENNVRDDLPPVDVLVSCDECGHRFWVRPIDPFDDPDDEIPPGMLAIACVRPEFGGGTQVVCGNQQGNTAITSSRQAQAVNRMTGGNPIVNAEISSVRDAEREAHKHLRRQNKR